MLSILALASGASAASNAFTNPITNVTVQSGSYLNITWKDASGPTVGLQLLAGEVNAMTPVATVATGLANQGEYIWAVPQDIKTGEYALEILGDDGDNYSSIFTIIGAANTNDTASVNTTSSASASSSSTSAVAIAPNSTVSSTSSFASITGVVNATSAKTTSGEESSTKTKSTKTTSSAEAVAAIATGSNSTSSNSTSASSTRVLNQAAGSSSYVACAAVAGAALLLL